MTNFNYLKIKNFVIAVSRNRYYKTIWRGICIAQITITSNKRSPRVSKSLRRINNLTELIIRMFGNCFQKYWSKINLKKIFPVFFSLCATDTKYEALNSITFVIFPSNISSKLWKNTFRDLPWKNPLRENKDIYLFPWFFLHFLP